MCVNSKKPGWLSLDIMWKSYESLPPDKSLPQRNWEDETHMAPGPAESEVCVYQCVLVNWCMSPPGSSRHRASGMPRLFLSSGCQCASNAASPRLQDCVGRRGGEPLLLPAPVAFRDSWERLLHHHGWQILTRLCLWVWGLFMMQGWVSLSVWYRNQKPCTPCCHMASGIAFTSRELDASVAW